MTASQPSKAEASASLLVSEASRTSTSPESGLRFPGRTTARTVQPCCWHASAMCPPRKPVAPVRLTERLFIDAIRLVATSTRRFDPDVDEVVVLERPRQLCLSISAGDGAPMQVGNEQR